MNLPWLVANIIVPALLVFLLLGGLLGIALGIGLVVRTAPTLAWIDTLNRWVSTRRALRPLEVPRSIALRTRGGKLALGAFLAAGGAFTFWFLLLKLELPRLASVLTIDLQRWLVAAIVLHAAKWFLVAGSLLAVAVGVMLLAFPGALARVEAGMNRWYSTRRMIPPAGDTMDLRLELLVQRHPRAAGWVIAVACLLVAAAVAVLMAARS